MTLFHRYYMKKTLLAGATAILCTIMVIASCTKTDENSLSNYTCHCVITSSTGTNTVDLAFNNTTETDASSKCTTAQSAYSTGGATAVCALK